MYNILLPAIVLLIAVFYQSNARVLSASSPLIDKSPDTLAERDWSSDPESIFIAKDGEGCLNPVSSSKSKRENTNNLYDFSQFLDTTSPGADNNPGFNSLSPPLFDQTDIGANSNSDGNYISSLLSDKTNPGDNSNSNVNHVSPLANDATTPEGKTVTTPGSIDSGFLDLESAGTPPIGGDSLEGSSVAFSNSIPGSPSKFSSDVQQDTADIAEYVP